MNLTSDIVRELLDYNKETGFLIWRKRSEHWFKSERSFLSWNARFAGIRAGRVSVCSTGYKKREIKILGKTRLEHHIAWMWVNGDKIPSQIDHKNRDATDNRWENLRKSSYLENSRNRSLKSDNTSGVSGVHWAKKSNKWWARCDLKGKTHSIGFFKDIKEAEQAIIDFRSSHGFDPGHGKPAHYMKDSP